MNRSSQQESSQTKGLKMNKYLFLFILLYFFQTSIMIYIFVDRTREVEKLRETINKQQLKLQTQNQYLKHLEKLDLIHSALKAKDSKLEELQEKYLQQQTVLATQLEILKTKEAQDRLGMLLVEKDQKLEEFQSKYYNQLAESRILEEKISIEREFQSILAKKEEELNKLREEYYRQQVALLTQESAANDFKDKERVAQILEKFKTGLSKSEEEDLQNIILRESKRYGFDPNLILAIIQTESTFNNWAKSKQGALGLMQIQPPTAKSIAEDADIEWKGKAILYEPDNNIRIGLHYLAQLILHFEDVKLALAAYNMGPTAVKRLLEKGEEVPQEYIDKVLENYEVLNQPVSTSTKTDIDKTNTNRKDGKLKVAKEEKEK